MTLGELLKEMRGDMSLRDAAEKLGVSHTYLQRLESGVDPRSGKKIIPSITTLRTIAEGYKVPLESLLSVAGFLDDQTSENGSSRIDRVRETRSRTPKIVSMVRRHEEGADTSSSVTYIPSDFHPVTESKNIPIVAEIPCGLPVLTEDNITGYMPLPAEVVPNGADYVWVQAKGDSMVNARIFDGSLVLIRLQPEVESGEIAAVCVDDENATLKRLVLADDHIILMSENSEYKPMTYHSSRVRVVGKATKIMTDV